jgi:glycosyltransferase involved in cell wall biosynthesis
MVFTGQRPAGEIPHFVDACDILVSPRISGTNTPLKIYSYLRSMRPIVATNLHTHTQVLGAGFSLLVEPTPRALAEGLAGLIARPDERARLASNAAKVAAEKYSREAYLGKTIEVYRRLLQGTGTPVPASEAAASPTRGGGTA